MPAEDELLGLAALCGLCPLIASPQHAHYASVCAMRDPAKSTQMTTENHVYKSLCRRTLVYHIGKERASSTHGEQGTGAIKAR